jgi:hypothetical protein
MRPLLYNQFHGALWGAVVAQAWGQWVDWSAQPFQLWQDPLWHQRLQTVQAPLLASLPEQGSTFGQRELPLVSPTPAPSLAALIANTIPLALYYHDQPMFLAKRLTTYCQTHHLSADIFAPALRWLTLLAAILSKSDSLSDASAAVALANPLANEPEAKAIALGMECFLATPQQFWLSLQRTRARESHPSSADVIGLASLTAGTLAGAYSGYLGLPLLAPVAVVAPLRERAHVLYAPLGWDGCCSVAT